MSLTALLATCTIAAEALTDKPTNFILFFVDDMGIDQIKVPLAQRSYGYTGNNGTIKTPHVSRLASEGMVFQTWYSGFHVCTPSRAAMVTGRLPVRSGIGSPNGVYAKNAPGPSQGNNHVFTGESIGGLPLNESTFAERLRPLGYKSLCIGKWHLGQRDMYLPTSRGFDEYLGIPFSQDIGLSFWATHNYHPSGPYFPSPLPLLNGTTVLEQPTDLFTIALKYASLGSNFVATHAAAKTPFMLYFPFNHIHGPNSCGARWCGQSARGPIGDATEETDWIIGEVMTTLRASAASKDTLVFFSSDNGAPVRPDGNTPLVAHSTCSLIEWFPTSDRNELANTLHGWQRGYKGSIWEGGYREPGIAWWPGKIKAGSRSEALVATYDLFPTVLALAGAPPPPPGLVIDGIDLSAVLFNGDTTGHKCITFYRYPHAATSADPTNLAAMRCGDYKVYWFVDGGPPPGIKPGVQPKDKPVVFNLATDWGEDRPLAPTDPSYAPAVKAAEAARVAHLATIEIVPDQNARGNDPALAICGAPNSQKRYPQWPNCSLTPQYWTIPICGSPSTWWCNQTTNGTCPLSCHGHGPPGPPPAPLPPPGPPMPAANYKGCFHDHAGEQRCDLPHIISGHCGHTAKHEAWARTVEGCNAMCQQFKYFGVQMGGSGCFCGNSYGSQGKATSDTLCNKTCTGNPKEVCGGPNLNSVWSVREN